MSIFGNMEPLKCFAKSVNHLRQRKENRLDGFRLWTLLKCKMFPSTNQIAWKVYKDEELELLHVEILYQK